MQFQEKITWTDLLNPTKKDPDLIKDNFNLHPIVIDELTHPSAHPKAELYNGYFFFAYHLPITVFYLLIKSGFDLGARR